MYSIFAILITLAAVVVLLQRRVSMGLAMFAGCVVLQLATLSSPASFFRAVLHTLQNPSTWEIIIALYFVMCLEHQLRTSGLLDAVMAAARAHLLSDKFLLAGMPAFLGFLPSVGGALFSAPLVQNASQRYDLTAEQKASINFWFRHVWEFTNPILPSLLLTSQISGIALGVLVENMAWASLATLAVGWAVCLATIREKEDIPAVATDDEKKTCDESCRISGRRAAILTAGPIFLNILLVVVFHLAASLSMAVVVTLMILILKQPLTSIKVMLIRALDRKMFLSIAAILLFQEVLKETDTLTGVVAQLQSSQVSTVLIGGFVALVAGLLTGTSSGFVAVSMPILAGLAPGNVTVVAVAYVMGTVGQMLSPMHMCFVVTIEYFKADFMGTLRPIIGMEVVMVALAALWVWFR